MTLTSKLIATALRWVHTEQREAFYQGLTNRQDPALMMDIKKAKNEFMAIIQEMNDALQSSQSN